MDSLVAVPFSVGPQAGADESFMVGRGVRGAVLLALVDIMVIFARGGLGMMYDVVVMFESWGRWAAEGVNRKGLVG